MTRIPDDCECRGGVSVTEFRRHMAHYIAAVRYGDDWLCIRRKGTDPVYLVSETDFRLICEKVDDMAEGPRDPKTGRRSGRGFMHWVYEALTADRKAGRSEVPAPPTPTRERPVYGPATEAKEPTEDLSTPEARLALLERLSKQQEEREARWAARAKAATPPEGPPAPEDGGQRMDHSTPEGRLALLEKLSQAEEALEALAAKKMAEGETEV